MEKKLVTLTEDEFYKKFTPIKNHINNDATFDGCFFDTFDEEGEYINKMRKTNPNKVWTITESDGIMSIESGYCFVNRLGYLITEEEVDENTEIVVELDVDKSGFQCCTCLDFFDEPDEYKECPLCGSGDYVRGSINEPEK